MIAFLCDDEFGQSCWVNADTWEEAQEYCDQEGWTLIGEYIESQPGPLWLTEGETMQ